MNPVIIILIIRIISDNDTDNDTDRVAVEDEEAPSNLRYSHLRYTTPRYSHVWGPSTKAKIGYFLRSTRLRSARRCTIGPEASPSILAVLFVPRPDPASAL